MKPWPAMVTVTRRDDTLTYTISDPDGSGVAEITIPVLLELFEMAGIKPEEQA